MPADLQSAPFGHFGTYPFSFALRAMGDERMQSLELSVHQKVNGSQWRVGAELVIIDLGKAKELEFLLRFNRSGGRLKLFLHLFGVGTQF